MTKRSLAYMLGVDDTCSGYYPNFQKRLRGSSFSEFYVYKDGFVLLDNGEIREPSVYVFKDYFRKIKGIGHTVFGAHTYDGEYQIFLNKNSALEYATKKQEEFLERKKEELDKKEKKELKLLVELAEKYNYKLIENK